jgi:hypothetical protein
MEGQYRTRSSSALESVLNKNKIINPSYNSCMTTAGIARGGPEYPLQKYTRTPRKIKTGNYLKARALRYRHQCL